MTEYVRHRDSGQRGVIIEQHGQRMVRHDRERENIVEPLSSKWLPEAEQKPFGRFQVAQVCFSADVMACRFLGVPLRKNEWRNLLDEEKIDFADHGPPDDAVALRKVLYERIKSALSDFTGTE